MMLEKRRGLWHNTDIKKQTKHPEGIENERRTIMNIMNYHLYANTAKMHQILAEDAGVAELRNPVFYIRTKYSYGRIDRIREKLADKWNRFWDSHKAYELIRA